mmetsp:Transcript_56953/g.123290  ORF Transcript_56953/g.123290 Transcript_56953/m.123290 type:complete len:328 (-) Transcript_56953:161-1144(-)
MSCCIEAALGVDSIAVACAEAGLWASTGALLSTCKSLASCLSKQPILLPGVPVAVRGRYDWHAHLWHPVPGTMTKLPGSSEDREAVVLIGGGIYRLGSSPLQGSPRTDGFERFDPVTGEWILLPAMCCHRAGHSATAIGDKLYVCGGYDNRLEVIQDCVEVFDLTTEKWTKLTPMSVGRWQHAAAALRGKLYICGGITTSGFVQSVERFDPDTNLWEDLPPLSVVRDHHIAAAFQGELYVCDGYSVGHSIFSLERFDPITNLWTRLPPIIRSSATLFRMEAWQGALYIAYEDFSGMQSLKLDPATGLWETVPLLLREIESSDSECSF